MFWLRCDGPLMMQNHDPLQTTPAQRRSPCLSAALVGAVAVLAPTLAVAAEGDPSGSSIAVFIAELGVLLLVGRIMGEAAQRLGQPSVMGQLVAGLLLGPSVLGLIWPQAQHALFPDNAVQKSMIDGVSQLGILMLLLLTGMETDLQLVKRVGRAAIMISIAGVAIPLVLGIALGEMLPDSLLPKPEARFVTALFLGTALSISSVKIVAMVVREMNFMRRDIGQIIVASAILEDTIGWIIVAIAFGLASAATVDVWSVGRAVFGTIIFLGLSLTIGRRIVFTLIRWANDNFESDFPVITTILVIMVAMALTTQSLGVNMVLGAFVAGVLVGKSPILTRHIDEQLRGLIVALFMPVFFGLSGLSANLTILGQPDLALLAVGLVFIASAGKFIGAFVGGKIGGLARGEALALACAMNARGSTEIIIASLGLSMSVLSQNLFTLIVTMAVITTTAMPPMLRWALKRLPLREEEKIRLEQEELDARGFVTNLERLLLVVDDSPNGKFAAQLGGVLGGSTGKPTTILEITPEHPDNKKTDKKKTNGNDTAKPETEEVKEEVESAAKRITTLEAHPEEQKPGSVHVTTVRKSLTGPDAVAEEARKGYDLLIVGLSNTHDPNGGFSADVSLVAKGFEGPIAVVDVPNWQESDLAKHASKILIPVNGTDNSRRAAEVGFTLARANGAQVTVLYVTPGKGGKRLSHTRSRASRRSDIAVLKDIAALAKRYEVIVHRKVQVDTAPDEAIIKEAKNGYTLVVLGANRRPGDTLFFGNTAAAVLDRLKIAKCFVAS